MMPAAMMESISLQSVFRSNSVIIICIPFVKNRPALTAGRRRVCYVLGRKCQEEGESFCLDHESCVIGNRIPVYDNCVKYVSCV